MEKERGKNKIIGIVSIEIFGRGHANNAYK